MWLISQVLQNKKKNICQTHDLSLWWTKILSQKHTHTLPHTSTNSLSHIQSTYKLSQQLQGTSHPWWSSLGTSNAMTQKYRFLRWGVWGTLKNMNWNYTVPGRQSSETWTEITLYQADDPQKHELKLLCTRQTTTVYYYHQDLLADTLQHSGADAQFTKQPQYMILEKVVPMLNNTGMYNAEELKWIFQQLHRGSREMKEGGLLKEERRPSMVH